MGGWEPERPEGRLTCMGIRMRSGRVAAGVVATALLAGGCASAQAAGPLKGVPAASAAPYGAADTTFGMNVLRAWCQSDTQANLVLSPASLATGLGMAYLGARGATAQAMASVLHLPGGSAADAALLAGLRARTQAIAGLDGPGVKLAQSNQVWADPSLTTLRSYLNALATAYSAGVDRVPLQTDPARAAQEIDQEVSAATDGQIPKLVSPSMLTGIGWVLTDALYLNADWSQPFQANETGPGPFTTAAGRTVTATYLNGGGYKVGRADGWTGVQLPYRGGKVSMVALLPPASAGGSCALPSAAALHAITASTTSGSISLPKVSLRSSASLEGLLSGLGMGAAFGRQADFSGISPQAGGIGFVQQDATLQVTEKGTVAAAATGVGIVATATSAPKGPLVTFNRPYLLLITTSTGEPLFLVRVANPVSS
jgi:serine protease inhibitor